MVNLTPNVYVESGVNPCNLGFVTTKEGIVMIDTPTDALEAVKWRDELNKKGELRYVINTEEHGDHCSNSWFFPGVLITSQATRDKLSRVTKAEVKERVKRADPSVQPLMEGFQLRLADITFSERLKLYVGNHTFVMFALPGHSSGGIGVFIPEERIVFTTDCVFHKVKSWLQEAEPDKWLESLRKIGELEVDTIVPGHGEICNKDYLKEQAEIVRNWVEAVQSAIKQGWSQEEALSRVSSPDPYPVQPGLPMDESRINKMSIERLYQLYSK